MAREASIKNLTNAKRAKNDEFYTQYIDIQKEIEKYLDYNPNTFRAKVVYCNCDDPYIKNRKGIFEYILGGSEDTKFLDIRVFDEATRRSVYAKQTKEAETKEKSNCSHCSIGHDANKSKIWSFGEMEADHVSAWSKGGSTSAKNCEMLCKTHNRAKGNR